MKLKHYQLNLLTSLGINVIFFAVVALLAMVGGIEGWDQFFAYLMPLELIFLLCYLHFKLWQQRQKHWKLWRPQPLKKQLIKYFSNPSGVESEVRWNLDRVLVLVLLGTIASFSILYYWLPTYYVLAAR